MTDPAPYVPEHGAQPAGDPPLAPVDAPAADVPAEVDVPVVAPQAAQDHLLSNGVYNVVKFLAQILIPAVGTLYAALAAAWGLPYAQQVLATVVAVDALLGGLLSLSSASYNKSTGKFDGAMIAGAIEDGLQAWHIQIDPAAVVSKSELLLKVKS